jgi:taurine---2-oxoglutarate transaminase
VGGNAAKFLTDVKGAVMGDRPEVSEELKRWDRDYVLHVEQTKEEYRSKVVVGAEGSWLTMADGRRLLDLHSQYMCVGVGHNHPRIREALHKAVDEIDFVCELLTTPNKGLAAKLLLEDTMEGWAGAARFVSTGSESVEAALLVARLYTNRPGIVVTQTSYHGWTTGAAAATTLPYLRDTFTDVATGEVRALRTSHGEFHPAPAPLGAVTPEQVTACVTETERLIRAVGVENVAAFMTEIWHGAGGYIVPDEYVRQIREMTRRLGILWIDDEVIAGAGRTGRWWAYQHAGVEPDILCTAKGLTSSAVPAGAVVVSRDIADYIGRGHWAAVSTFSGHPLALAAVVANLQLMLDEKVVDRVADLGAEFGRSLDRLAAAHRCVASVSGRGFAWAIELQKDSRTGERWIPADRWWTPSIDGEPKFRPGLFVADECEREGVLLFNFLPNTVTLAPPLLTSPEDLQLAVDVLDRALGALDERTA